MTISKREAFFLFILVLVGMLVVSFNFIIFPIMNEITALKNDKDRLISEKLIIDATLPQLGGLRNQQELKLGELNTQLAEIEDPIDAAEFERWVLPLTTRYDMMVNSASLSAPVVTTPNGMIIIVDEPSYTLKTLIANYVEAENPIKQPPTSNTQLLKTTNTYNVETTYNRFVALLDEVTVWNNSFIVSSATYNFSTSIASVTIEAYMIDKIVYTSDKDYLGDYNSSGSNNSADDSDNPWTKTAD